MRGCQGDYDRYAILSWWFVSSSRFAKCWRKHELDRVKIMLHISLNELGFVCRAMSTSKPWLRDDYESRDRWMQQCPWQVGSALGDFLFVSTVKTLRLTSIGCLCEWRTSKWFLVEGIIWRVRTFSWMKTHDQTWWLDWTMTTLVHCFLLGRHFYLRSHFIVWVCCQWWWLFILPWVNDTLCVV